MLRRDSGGGLRKEVRIRKPTPHSSSISSSTPSLSPHLILPPLLSVRFCLEAHDMCPLHACVCLCACACVRQCSNWKISDKVWTLKASTVTYTQRHEGRAPSRIHMLHIHIHAFTLRLRGTNTHIHTHSHIQMYQKTRYTVANHPKKPLVVTHLQRWTQTEELARIKLERDHLKL